jgi:hypothetical protein
MQIIKNTNQQLIQKIPGNYYTDELAGTSTASSGSAVGQSITYTALLISDSIPIIELAFNQTNTAVGVSYKCNVYDSDPLTLLPRNKLLGSDVVLSADTAGVKIVPVNRVLKGLHYLAVTRTGGASPTLTTKANTSHLGNDFGLGSTTILATPNLGTRLTTFTFAGNMPNPATQDSPSITYLSTTILMVWYKI